MPSAAMTTKGQITVPVAVRRALGLEPGSRLQFVERPDGAFELRPATYPVQSLKGFFGLHLGPAVTVEQMNETIADAAAEAL
ncbi:MAG: AbrB/MazE/SpoVT family DNA-binding domain-containing protein [Promicromonosporaceae bacterium]|nr:AbrB/MazE/SpoVT family DNA-binding domain-containing protein [Promicromonosporaceae bacterium]